MSIELINSFDKLPIELHNIIFNKLSVDDQINFAFSDVICHPFKITALQNKIKWYEQFCLIDDFDLVKDHARNCDQCNIINDLGDTIYIECDVDYHCCTYCNSCADSMDIVECACLFKHKQCPICEFKCSNCDVDMCNNCYNYNDDHVCDKCVNVPSTSESSDTYES
jgi:hypothetical protein